MKTGVGAQLGDRDHSVEQTTADGGEMKRRAQYSCGDGATQGSGRTRRDISHIAVKRKGADREQSSSAAQGLVRCTCNTSTG